MLTILSAKYSNADQTALVAMTEESATVLITRSLGKAEKWAALQEWMAAGGVIDPYEPRNESKPRDLAAELDALHRLIVQKGIASEDEIEAALSSAEDDALEFAADENAAAAEGEK